MNDRLGLGQLNIICHEVDREFFRASAAIKEAARLEELYQVAKASDEDDGLYDALLAKGAPRNVPTYDEVMFDYSPNEGASKSERLSHQRVMAAMEDYRRASYSMRDAAYKLERCTDAAEQYELHMRHSDSTIEQYIYGRRLVGLFGLHKYNMQRKTEQADAA